jgi:chitinase
MTYSLALANIAPTVSAFTVNVHSVVRSVSSVAISGTKVLLPLSSPVAYGDVVTVAYTKPASNPLQTTSGGQAASLSVQSVTNNCIPPVTNQPPTISISSPNKNSSFISPTTITINAIASDLDGSILIVEFFNGSVKLGETTTVPFSYKWKDLPAGTYSLNAVATDNLNAKTVSPSVSVTVSNSISTGDKGPKIKITKPNNGKKYATSSSIDITIDSYDPDSTISKVEYFVDTEK